MSFDNFQLNLHIFYRMQELSNDNLQLNLIDTTSVFTKRINNNCHFDGSTLVYLAGAHILFHNVFQNGKQFLQRVSDNQVMAVAFHHSTELTVLLVTKDPFCHVEFYFSAKKTTVVDIHQQLQILDAIFLQKKRVCLLAYDRNKKEASLIIVSSNKKVKKVDIAEKCYKLSGNQRKMYILAQYGCYEMNIETEMLQKKKVYQSTCLRNIIITQSQEDILFDNSGHCFLMQDYKQKQSCSLAQHFQRTKVQYQSAVRIGHNLLITIKGQFVLAHFIIQENKLCFVNKFQYSEKVRGNIIAMHSSIDQMNLAIALQTTYKDRTRIEHFLFNLSALSNQKKFINPFLKLQSGGEIGEVSNLQCIIPSQMYCLVGPHIINYTYVEHIEKKHKYSIHQSPKFIAVHPLGHQLLCIFETSFKFYQKVEMELVETWTESMVCSCARYTESGLLILCVYEQGFQNIVVYNPNNFRRMRTFNGLYLKHAVSRIDLDESQQQLILYSQKDLFIHRFKSGERLSQFRQKREMTDVTCIQYDFIRKWLLVASRQSIIICKKTQDYMLNFNSQKVIQVDHEVTCIHISQHAQTIFFGTANGVILYSSYPLLQINQQTIEDRRVYKAVYQSVKIHSQSIANIMLTNNCKFLFTSIKGDGISILRAKRLSGGKGTYNPFDSSNYNFIQTSSTPYLQNVHQKLKSLLEKRKTIFNQLDQFKKEWQGKRITETKKLTTQNKRKELQHINNALEEINKCKIQHALLMSQLSSFQSLTLNTQEQNQKIHHKQLLLYYEENDKRKEKLKNAQQKCQNQWKDIVGQCSTNLQDIRQELQVKFRNFQTTYLIMKNNLLNYKRRMQFEESQDIAVRQELVASTKLRLKEEQEQLYKRSNELKGQITKNRKQLERFVNRKDFLQNKQRFFIEQLKYCDNEQNQLIQVKENLQKQLVELENVTHKKEKRLRKYFIQNQILIKYQIIHDNLTKQSNKEVQFIEDQHHRLRQNIGQLQKEILFVSEQRQKHKKQLQSKKNKLQSSKIENIKLKQKRDFLTLQVESIEDSINATNTGKIVDQQSKNEDFLAIYHDFYVEKQLETFLSSRQAKTDQLILSQNKRSEEGVQAVLQDHKQYLVKNMQLFEKYNTRVMDQINLTFLKYQTENYDLISQCNVRKEQINKKKRILHELVNSIRTTNTRIAALHQTTPLHKQPSHPPPQIPFPIYEQAQHQEKLQLRKDKSQSAMWKIKKSSYQVRKMLQIQKLKSNNNPEPLQKDKRRIQTATLKNKTVQYNHEQIFAQQSLDVMNQIGFVEYEKKPQTAFHRYRKKENQQAKRLFSRNKSNSKPTTCTSHTKSKKSLFI